MIIISQVDHNLFVGSRPQELSDYQYAAALGIQNVVDLTSNIGYDVSDDGQLWMRLGIIYKHIPVLDAMAPTLDDVRILEQEVFPLAQVGFNTFIHCRMGQGRSPTVAILYYMLVHGLNYNDALAIVTNSNEKTYINYEQEKFLKQFESQHEEEDEELDKQEKQYMREWVKEDSRKVAEKKGKHIK